MKPAPLTALLFPALLLGCAHREERPFNAPAVTTASPSRQEGDYDFAATAKNANSAPYAVGKATWYGEKFAGKKTSNGELFDPRNMTAAHRKLPFGTWVEVRRIDTGAVVRVRINDRGPWGDDSRIIDLAQAAAERIGLVAAGIVKVELRVVSGPE